MGENEKRLEEEYKFLVNRWDDYDRRALTIKGWTSAGALVGITSIDKSTSCTLIFAAIAIVTSAWITEAIWKSWQHANEYRIHMLENYFRSDTHYRDEPISEMKAFQIHRYWIKPREHEEMDGKHGDPSDWRKIGHEMLEKNTLFPYAVIIAVFVAIVVQRLLATEHAAAFRELFVSLSACVT